MGEGGFSQKKIFPDVLDIKIKISGHGIYVKLWKKKTQQSKAVFFSFRMMVALFSFRAYSADSCMANFNINKDESSIGAV